MERKAGQGGGEARRRRRKKKVRARERQRGMERKWLMRNDVLCKKMVSTHDTEGTETRKMKMMETKRNYMSI